MSKPITGIIHVHSDFSSDALCSIAYLADFARDIGFGFVGLTDHAEDLSSEDTESLRHECDKHSDESCVVIPGLEFRCKEDIHILGLGITNGVTDTDPVAVASQIRDLGGLAVLAHPGRNGFQCPPELCRVLNGIEIWNAADDGRFIPPVTNLHLFQEARSCNPAISAFGGADLHWVDGPPGVKIELRSKANPVKSEMVLDCLRSGEFTIQGRYVALDARVTPNWLTRSWIWMLRKSYEISKSISGA